MIHSDDRTFRRRMERMETLIRAIERSPDAVQRAQVQEMVQTILELHAAGLEKLLDRVASAGEVGLSILDELGRDDLVGSLLLLHGLHPLDVETRVRQAVEEVRSHGGDVEIVAITDDEVRLRIRSNGHGCSSAQNAKRAVEEAIYARAPDVAGLRIDEESGAQPAVTFVPLEELLGRKT
jgi:Fe-S cluster biogenesis protein NfuA